MANLVLVVTPHIRRNGTKHPNAFDARLDGDDAVLCVSETPLLDGARALLASGQARPDDVIIMRHAGAQHDALRGKAGMLAELTISDPPSGRRISLVKRRQDFGTVQPGIEPTPSLVPEAPSTADASV